MHKLDYIIVGLGIAGVSFCETLQRAGKTFVVVDDGETGATYKSGGVFNPTVLKRFNAAWNSELFYPSAVSFYKQLELRLHQQLFVETSIFRIFKSIEEQNNWSVATDKKNMEQFLSAEFVKNSNPCINAPLGFGKVVGTAQIKTKALLSSYKDLLVENNSFLDENFEYELLKIKKNYIEYKGLSAKKIVFAEGAGAFHNPYFPERGIVYNKGEYIIINAPTLNLEKLLKGPLYIIPLGNSQYKVGATYSRDDLTTNTTEAAKNEIIPKLKSMINCPYEVIGQTAGVRPTTRDRRPLIGRMDRTSPIAFFNGLGSRGFTMAPKLAEILFEDLENEIPIPQEMDIARLKTN